MLQYAQDYDETFCMCWTCESNSNATASGAGPGVVKWSSWVGLMTAYHQVKSTFAGAPMILYCPTDASMKGRNGSSPRSYALAATTSNTATSYSSSAVVNDEAGQGFAGPIKNGLANWVYQSGHQASEIPSPANLFMIVELPGAANLTAGGSAVCYRPDTNPGTYVSTCDANSGGCGQNYLTTTDTERSLNGYHNGGWNYAFADGHVKWLQARQTTASNYVWNTWGPKNPHGYWSLTPTN
jgi:prepilin-type processing-associated H-X9-DG protein